MTFARSPSAGYVAAVLLVGAAFMARTAVAGADGTDRLLIVPFLPAVIVAAWIGGLLPGLFATALATAAAALVVDAGASGGIDDAVSLTRLLFFVLGGLVISMVGERARRWRQRELGLHEQAAASRQWLDAVIAGIPDPFCTVDADWRMTAVSDRFAELRGRPRAELVGAELWERCPDLLGTEFERHVRRIAARKGEATFETRDERTGRWFTYHIYSSAAGISILMSDVSDTRRAIDTLRHEQELLQRLVDTIPVMITMYDPASRLLRVNREFERLTGFSGRSGAESPLVEESIPDPANRQIARDFLESGSSGWLDLRLRTRDGQDLETSWATIQLSDNTVVGVGIDVTSRRQSQQELARLGAIVEFSEDAIVSKALDGTILSWNAAAERMYGYSAAEVIGQPITMIIPPDREGEERRILAAIQRGDRVHHYETVRLTKDGRALDVSLTISPMRDSRGAIVGASKVARDITARKQAERAAQEGERRKDEFLATLAHELRNPLAPIRSSLELLRLTGGGSPPVRNIHELLDRQVRHLVRLVDDLLDVSRITHNRIELQRQRVNLLDAVRGAVETARPVMEARRQHFVLSLPDQPVPVEGDAVRLTQIVSNLLQNATKFTHEGGEISVSVERTDGTVELRVRDNGRGIEPEFLPKVFALFAQSDHPPEHESAGLGVGLTLVQRLVELHGGHVEAHSDGLGRGSEFVVQLPVSDRPPASVAPASAPAVGALQLPGPVLVVDDNRDAAESMALLLRYLGADVVVAHDGTDALALLSEHQPSVVLLDIGLPGMDGYQVAEMIRAHPFLRDTRLVALTGWGHDEARRRAKESGFEHHLVKPVDVEVLRALLVKIGEGLKA